MTTQVSGEHMLVVIDHREARVFKTELHGTIPQRLTPFDPHGFGRNLHSVEEGADGKRRPEQKSFYEAVIKTLEHAEKILIFGSGKGASSAMDQLDRELQSRHKELFKRVIGTVVLDQQHLSDNELLARARVFYETDAATRKNGSNSAGH